MPQRLLVIDDADSPVDDWIGHSHTTRTGTIIEKVRWSSVAPERLHNWRSERSELLLFVVQSGVPAVVRVFQRLRDTPTILPTIAVIPESVDCELLQLASSAVDDFVIAPIRGCELQYRIARMLARQRDTDEEPAHQRLVQEIALTGLIGSDPAFLPIVRKLPLAAASSSPVLIVGETGTGKEVCARAIHVLSTRRDAAFVPVDCAALPEHLFENELFGHARGAFTDARQEQKGLVELARGGTLFLDEIDSLSLAAQSKLLRFLQELTYRPLDSERFFSADVKVIAASNKDLEHLIRLKQMRSDLFFRLNVLRLEMIPLRERRGDIMQLATHFLEMLSAQNGGVKKTFTQAMLRRLTQYEWPGNVRELYNAVQRGFTFSEGTEILPWHIFEEAKPAANSAPTENFSQAPILRALHVLRRKTAEISAAW